MDTETLRDTLENTGLTQYEADAYIAVLELQSGAATEVANASDVPQARIYDVLRSLESKGYIETYEQGTLHARAHHPDKVLDELEAYADTVSNAAKEIKERWTQPSVENHKVSVVKPQSSIFHRAEEAIASAEEEIEVAVTPAQFKQLRDSLAEAYQRNVVVKITLTSESEDHAEWISDLEFDGVAAEVRHRRLPTPFLLLVDRNRVCFAPETPLHPTHEYGLFVNDFSLSQMFHWYFQTAIWESWDTVYTTRDETVASTYTNIRDCVRVLRSLLEDGHMVVLTVVGTDRSTRTEQSWTGEVVGVTFHDSGAGDESALASFVYEASIRLRTPDGEYEVGGWGALVEDIAGKRFIIEAIN